MRDLSDREIKKLYENEYKNVPDVWDKVSCRIEQQGQETTYKTDSRGDEEDTVLHFAKLGRKRKIMMVATLAACCVIVCAYVLQNGSLMTQNGKGSFFSDEAPRTEAAMPDDIDMIQSDADATTEEPATAAAGDAIDYAAQTEAAAAEQAEEDNCSLQKNETGIQDTETAYAMLNVNGVVYCYDETMWISFGELENMKRIGQAVYVTGEETPTEHLTVTGMDIQGIVFESATGEMYILEDDTKQVYGFR